MNLLHKAYDAVFLAGVHLHILLDEALVWIEERWANHGGPK